MRFQFAAALVLTVAVAGTFWYKTTEYMCPVPMGYHLGTLDPAFNTSAEAVKAELLKAEKVWEAEAGRELFYYDEKGPVVVDFVFDERQSMADSELTERQQLDAKKADNDKIFEKVAELQKEYESRNEEHRKEIVAYEAKLTAYNEKVGRYNDQGGAPPDVFDELERENARLVRQSDELNKTTDQLNQMVEKINQLGEEGNKLVEAYNREVAVYNEQFGYSREFTQGDYGGGRINIYKFSSPTELETVLVHEFGHALGIDHVEDDSSVMYYLLGDTSTVPTLSDEDKTAFIEVCGTGDEWPHRLRQMIRTTLLSITT